MEFFTQRYGGEVGSRVEMNDRIAQLLSGDLAASLLNVLMAGFYIALMVYYDLLIDTGGHGHRRAERGWPCGTSRGGGGT